MCVCMCVCAKAIITPSYSLYNMSFNKERK